jgi:hypothetical protein
VAVSPDDRRGRLPASLVRDGRQESSGAPVNSVADLLSVSPAYGSLEGRVCKDLARSFRADPRGPGR